jgi:hypothetical protein
MCYLQANDERWPMGSGEKNHSLIILIRTLLMVHMSDSQHLTSEARASKAVS